MSDFRKLVSTVLVLLIPTISGLALSACPHGIRNMGDPNEHMDMVGMVSPVLSFSVSPNNLCCEVAPAEMTPRPPARAGASDENIGVKTDVTSGMQVLEPDKTKTQQDDIPGGSSPPQALLCVFLI